MAGSEGFQADPSAIGGVPQAPYVVLPNPRRVFAQRAARFEGLAATSPLAPYLRFLAALTALQADLVTSLPASESLPSTQVDRAESHAMPLLDRGALATDPDTVLVLHRLFDAAQAIAKPAAAAAALEEVRSASPDALAVLVDNVLADDIPTDALASHLYVAAGLQVLAARLAATLHPTRIQPIGVGICPVCGGLPVSSVVLGVQGAEGARYAACSLCATLWNEVRVKCLACGSTRGIGYREVDEGEAATVKGEVCDECRSWVKILYQTKNPSLDPVADDVASLGLDLLVRDAGYRHAGFNPLLLGY